MTVAEEARSQALECPRCHHEAAGEDFLDEAGEGAEQVAAAERADAADETPLPPPGVAENENAGGAAPVGAEGSDANAASEPADDARTFLMLRSPYAPASAPPDEGRTRLLSRAELAGSPLPPPPPSARAARAGGREASDEARTHLLLDASELAEEGDERAEHAGEPAPAGAPPAAASRQVSDEERTHLLLDASELVEERDQQAWDELTPAAGGASAPRSGGAQEPTVQEPTVQEPTAQEPTAQEPTVQEPTAQPARPARAAERALLDVGLWLEERLHGKEPAAVGGLALVAGVLPWLAAAGGEADSAWPLLGSLLLLAGLGALGLTRLRELAGERGELELGRVSRRARGTLRLLQEDLQVFGEAPPHLRLAITARLLILAGLAGLLLASLLSVVRALLGLPDPPGALRLLSGMELIGALLLRGHARRARPAAALGPEELAESLGAARKLPALLDLAEPLPESFVTDITQLHRVVVALSQWRGAPLEDEGLYRRALARHLERELPGCRIERDRWFGRTRRELVADVVVDELVWVEARRGLDAAAARQLLERLPRCASAWPGKPIVLAIFDAPREAVFESSAASGLTELHDQLPVIAVRMPVRRW